MLTLIRWLERATMAIAVLCVLTIMLVVSYDAVSRYVFNAPLPWAFELVTYYMMVVAIYFALSSTFTHGDHINIDLFQQMMSPRVRAVCDVVASLAAAAAFAVICYGTAEDTLGAYRRQEFLPGVIVWPAWLSHVAVPLGSGLLVLRLVAHAVVLARRGVDPAVASHAEPLE